MSWQMPPGAWGVCNVCKEVVMVGEERTHPCPDYYVGTGWRDFVNPHNTEWVPGYRFYVTQPSKNAARRNSGRMRTREYAVHYEIDQDGLLRWTGGVSPTDRTQELVEELYARGRPGSNYG